MAKLKGILDINVLINQFSREKDSKKEFWKVTRQYLKFLFPGNFFKT
ncbi:MAG: hypothetical protein GXO71_01370 [Caldiserica bacterium]|nr:hypothetical protein [Caldisericota bacterium]